VSREAVKEVGAASLIWDKRAANPVLCGFCSDRGRNGRHDQVAWGVCEGGNRGGRVVEIIETASHRASPEDGARVNRMETTRAAHAADTYA